MKPTEIGQAYDQITHLWESEAFDRSNGIDQHKRALAFVSGRDKALDVGCGCTGRFIDLLQCEGFSAEGVDISESMIGLAKHHNPNVVFYTQDICQWVPEANYDFITAWDSLWHIPLCEQERVIAKLLAALNPKGVLIFSCGGTDEKEEHIDDFMGPKLYYASLGINGFLRVLLEAGCICRHLEYDQYPEMHSYLIAQRA